VVQALAVAEVDYGASGHPRRVDAFKGRHAHTEGARWSIFDMTGNFAYAATEVMRRWTAPGPYAPPYGFWQPGLCPTPLRRLGGSNIDDGGLPTTAIMRDLRLFHIHGLQELGAAVELGCHCHASFREQRQIGRDRRQHDPCADRKRMRSFAQQIPISVN